jgi:hypothetical protein
MARRGRISRAWSRGELDKAFNEVKDNYARGTQAHANDYVAGLKAYLMKYVPAVEAEFLNAVKETVGSDDLKKYAEATMFTKYEVARKVGEFTSKYAKERKVMAHINRAKAQTGGAAGAMYGESSSKPEVETEVEPITL